MKPDFPNHFRYLGKQKPQTIHTPMQKKQTQKCMHATTSTEQPQQPQPTSNPMGLCLPIAPTLPLVCG